MIIQGSLGTDSSLKKMELKPHTVQIEMENQNKTNQNQNCSMSKQSILIQGNIFIKIVTLEWTYAKRPVGHYKMSW